MILYRCKTCDEAVVMREVKGHVRTSFKHVEDVECSAMARHDAIAKPMNILKEDDVYAVPAAPANPEPEDDIADDRLYVLELVQTYCRDVMSGKYIPEPGEKPLQKIYDIINIGKSGAIKRQSETVG